MDEAGIVDGCTPWQLFLKIMFPLLKPILVTLFITQFVFVWNDFQMPLYLIQSSKTGPLYWEFTISWVSTTASGTWYVPIFFLSSLPVILVYLAGQKYIIDGMVAEAL